MLWRRPRYRKTLLCSRQVQEPRRIVVPKKMRYLKQLCANLENRPDRKTIKSVLTLVISCLRQGQGRKRLLEVKTSHLLFILTVPRGLISG